jgi:hypothetical protein
MSTKTLHFTVGADAGKLVTDIAQEHLLYNYDPQKAIDTILNSLVGCKEDMAIDIIGGKLAILVDVDAQEFNVTDNPDIVKAVNNIDLVGWVKRTTKEIEYHSEMMLKSMEMMSNSLRSDTYKINYNKIFEYIANNKKEKLDELILDSEEYDNMVLFVKTTRDFILESINRIKVMKWIYSNYDDVSDEIHGIEDATNDLMDVQMIFQNMSKGILYGGDDDSTKIVDNYLEASQEINDIMTKDTFEPVDIMSKYSAGWLSPEGEYYALNGEIANMLHLQIADKLQEIGVIPSDDELDEDSISTKDSWLEINGWVKIHDNRINFSGCENHKLGHDNVNMTDVQVKMIYEYIALCHDGYMKLGWKQQGMSAARFQMAAKDMYALNKKYFAF